MSFRRILCIAVFIIFSVMILGCQSLLGIPDQDEIIDECQAIFDEERPKIISEIRDECSELITAAVDLATNEITAFCSSEIDDLQTWCSNEIQNILDMSIKNVLTELGCVEDASAALGWTCYDSKLCPTVAP